MKQVKQVILPAALLLIGVWLLVGCLYIPTFNMTTGGKDATKHVGDAATAKKLRTGVSTRQNVRRVLGNPFFETSDGRFIVYSWKKQKGLLIYPQCFQVLPENDAYAMTLEFGADGLMTGFDVEKRLGTVYLFDVPRAKKFVPDRVMIHQMGLDIQKDHPERLEEFRAATQRANVPPK